jgi:hypothetical protein
MLTCLAATGPVVSDESVGGSVGPPPNVSNVSILSLKLFPGDNLSCLLHYGR